MLKIKKIHAIRAICGVSAAVLAFPLLFASCRKNRGIVTLEETEVFSLEYGNFEDELNLFNFNEVGNINTSVVMRDGLYYVANGEAKKIMEMNGYGELLNLYYNADYNPTPSFGAHEKNQSTTRKAIVYPFNEISAITVDSRRYLYVVDKLPPERQEMDTERRQLLSQVVLRFDGDGNFLDYIGQQGPGGTPFPYIKQIYVTSANELVVVCLTNSGPLVYWFSTTGYLLFSVPIEKQNVPLPPSEGKTIDPGDIWIEVTNVVPDYSVRKLYLSVDYFSTYIDEASRMQSGTNYDSTLLYTLNVENGTYEKPLVISPYTEHDTDGFSDGSYNIPYDFLGVTESGWFFFIVSTTQGFQIQMVQSNGQRIMTRALEMDRTEVLYHTFNLSNNGILSVLQVKSGKSEIDWWRTDALIQSVLKN